ncbi:MAG: plasmid mobilization protein, partial [Bacteroides sp.]
MPKKYNTPHRSRVVKTRMTEEEYADFTERLQPYDMSQSEFIRQAISRAVIRPIVTVSPVNDELLSAIGELTAQYGKIGGRFKLPPILPYSAVSFPTAASNSSLTGETVMMGRMTAREIACRINSDW